MKRVVFLLFLLIGGLAGFLYVYLGIGAPKVIVPPLVGKELTSATKLLNSIGLHLKVTGEESSTTFPPNYIVSQKPLPGLSVKKGSVIEVVISGKGDMVEVPDLVGHKLSEVLVFIKEAGLVLGDVVKINYLLAADNVVLGQSVSPHRRVRRGSKIDLLVSLGPVTNKVSAPDLIGMSVKQAKRVLQDAGLKLGKVFERVQSGTPGVIIAQSPRPYTEVPLGSEVDITVRKASPAAASQPPGEESTQATAETQSQLPQSGATSLASIPGTEIPSATAPQEKKEKIGMIIPKGTRLIDFTFKVPPGKREKLVEIIQIDVKGEHLVFRRKCKPGEIISLRLPAFGDNVIRVLVDGKFYSEDRYPWKKR
ncbi:MAG: PASTA domain-containing protein [Synergistetes bacterium]|nr:PASTA domain-containing protein [Synergistota bacterium]